MIINNQSGDYIYHILFSKKTQKVLIMFAIVKYNHDLPLDLHKLVHGDSPSVPVRNWYGGTVPVY